MFDLMCQTFDFLFITGSLCFFQIERIVADFAGLFGDVLLYAVGRAVDVPVLLALVDRIAVLTDQRVVNLIGFGIRLGLAVLGLVRIALFHLAVHVVLRGFRGQFGLVSGQDQILQEEAYTHPKKNLLIKALGTDEKAEPDLIDISIQKDDVLKSTISNIAICSVVMLEGKREKIVILIC